MQQLPSPETAFQIKLSLLSLLALGLAVLGFFAVLTVLLAARRSIFPMQQIKSVAGTLLWVVPALGLVGLIGMKYGVARVRTENYVGQQLQTPEHGVYDEARSTARQSSSKPASPIIPSAAMKTKEKVSTIPEISPVPEIPPVAGIIPIPKIAPIPEITPIADTAEAERTSPIGVTEMTGAGSLRRTQREADRSQSPPAENVLKVVETRSGAPDWAGKDPVPSENGTLVSLSSQRFATLPEAEQQLTALAAAYVKEFYHDEYPLSGDWTVPVSLIERHAVRKIVGETLDQDFGNGIRGTMYRAHLQLELNSALRKGIHDSWHGQIVSHRLTALGCMTGLITLMLAASAGYFRLDDLTGGLYRGRLKFAAASLVAAGSLVALVVA